MLPPLDYQTATKPYEFVLVTPKNPVALPDGVAERILVHTVHDGGWIPKRFIERDDGTPVVDPQVLETRYIRERDWGANLVARKLAAALGVPGYSRCNVARVLLDFNRFPGSTPLGVRDPLERLAINRPFAAALNHEEKMGLLSAYYDDISDWIEAEVLEGKLMTIGVHTYDELNASATKRPDLSLIMRPRGYQTESRMPFGVFDPMYPDLLAESTCSRILRDRISLNLERAGFRVSHNHPYALPEGSMEVRAQVWYFFDFLRGRFQAEFPETCQDPAYELVWLMLLNTNLRLQRAEMLRSYLHRYRKPPAEERQRFRDASAAYERIRNYLANSSVITDYRRSRDRPSSFALEVRKDLVCRFDPETGRPERIDGVEEENAEHIAEVVAKAIGIFFETDREERRLAEMHSDPELLEDPEVEEES